MKSLGTEGRARWAVSVAELLLVLGLVWVVTLVGCGSGVGGAGVPVVQFSGDVCLFCGEVEPSKSAQPDATREGGDEKVTLTVGGAWRSDDVDEGGWERHRFETRAGIVYLVELTGSNSTQDDPDLFISRNPDPYGSYWRASGFGRPLPDVLCFRSNQDGVMYIGVQGFSSLDDNNVGYHIRVRQAHQALNTG